MKNLLLTMMAASMLFAACSKTDDTAAPRGDAAESGEVTTGTAGAGASAATPVVDPKQRAAELLTEVEAKLPDLSAAVEAGDREKSLEAANAVEPVAFNYVEAVHAMEGFNKMAAAEDLLAEIRNIRDYAREKETTEPLVQSMENIRGLMGSLKE